MLKFQRRGIFCNELEVNVVIRGRQAGVGRSCCCSGDAMLSPWILVLVSAVALSLGSWCWCGGSGSRLRAPHLPVGEIVVVLILVVGEMFIEASGRLARASVPRLVLQP